MHPTQPGPFSSTPPPPSGSSGGSHFGAQPPSSAPRSFGGPHAAPAKKSNAALWWILGGVGCVGILFIGVALAGVGAYVAYQQDQQQAELARALEADPYQPYYDPAAYGAAPTDPFAAPTDPFAAPADPFAAPTDPFGNLGQLAPPPTATVAYVPVGDSPQEGPDDALVTIVEFSDFQCPFCSRVNATLDRIRTTYGDDVRVVYKHNPLPFHTSAMPAAELSVAAYRSGGDAAFFRAHDTLFENQAALSRSDLEGYARRLGLSASDISVALDSHAHQSTIQADMELARTVGASGTPTFFINGEVLTGAQPYESFIAVIDRKRTEAQALVAAGIPRASVYDRVIASALIR